MKNKVWGINVIGSQGVNVEDDIVFGSNDDKTGIEAKFGQAIVSEEQFKSLANDEFSSVIANPNTSATATLSSVNIDGTTYAIAGGGTTYLAGNNINISQENVISVVDLANVALSGSYDDLTNKPTTIDHATIADSANVVTMSGVTGLSDALANKQDTISDLADIRTNAALGGTAVQPASLSTVAMTGSYNDLNNKPVIGPVVTANPEGSPSYTLNTIKIGEDIYGISGGSGEGFLTANTVSEANALCKAENLGKYVKYLGDQYKTVVDHTESKPYSFNFNKDTFLSKVSSAVVKYDIQYDGTEWKSNGESINLSEYGVSIYNGTPITPPAVGDSLHGMYANTSYLPTRSELESIASSRSTILSAAASGYYSGYYMGIIIDPHYIIEGQDICTILLSLSSSPEFPEDESEFNIVYGIEPSATTGEWDEAVEDLLEEYFSDLFGLTVSTIDGEKFSACSNFLSCYKFPHTPYVPESELAKEIGDTITLENKHIVAMWPPQIQTYDSKYDIYGKNINGLLDILQNDVTFQQYTWSEGRSVAPLYDYYYYDSCGELVNAVAAIHLYTSSGSGEKSLKIYYYDTDNNSEFEDNTLILPDQMPVDSIHAERAFQYDSGGRPSSYTISNVYTEQTAVLSQFLSFTRVFGDEVLNDTSSNIQYALRAKADVDLGTFSKAVKDLGLNKVGFTYDGEKWIPHHIYTNNNPFTTSDVSTEFSAIYFNIYSMPEFTTTGSKTLAYFGSLSSQYSISGLEYCFSDYYGICDLEGAVEFAYNKNYENIYQRGYIMSHFNTTNGALLNLSDLNSNIDTGENAVLNSIVDLEGLNKVVSKSPFVYSSKLTNEEMKEEYGITITGTIPQFAIIEVSLVENEYGQYRLYTVNKVDDTDEYKLNPTYSTVNEVASVANSIDKLNTKLYGNNIAIGSNAMLPSSYNSIAIGVNASVNSSGHGIAIGNNAVSSSYCAAQIGEGNNDYVYSLKFRDTMIVKDNAIQAPIYKNAYDSNIGVLKFVKCSQSEYNNLMYKDSNTFYIIVG